MAHYILISTPVNAPNSSNVSLIALLKYIGKVYKNQHSNQRIDRLSDYKAGVEWINKRCNGFYKTAIKRVVYSKDKTTYFGVDYRSWKFHKRKASRLLLKLYQILKECKAPKDIWLEFNCLYIQWKDIYGLIPFGHEIVALPYKLEFGDVICDRNRKQEDKNAARRIQDAFKKYDTFYHGTKEET